MLSPCRSRLCLRLAAGSAHPRCLLPDLGALPLAGPFLTPLNRWWGPLTPCQPSWLGISKLAEVRLYNMVFIWVPRNLRDLASPRVCCLLLWCPLPPLLPSVLSLQFSSALKDTGEIRQSLALVNGNIERDVGLSSCRCPQSLCVIHLIAPRIGGQGNELERLWSLEEYGPALSSRDSSSPCPQYLRETRKLVLTGLALLLWREV